MQASVLDHELSQPLNELIVDRIHSHLNSIIRVRLSDAFTNYGRPVEHGCSQRTTRTPKGVSSSRMPVVHSPPTCPSSVFRYSAVVTTMKILDPHLKDGAHEWRDGKLFVNESVKLYCISRLQIPLALAGVLKFPTQLRRCDPCQLSASPPLTPASTTSRASRDILPVKRLP